MRVVNVDVPDDVQELIKDLGWDREVWYVGSAEGSWESPSENDWSKSGSPNEGTGPAADQRPGRSTPIG
ncbi:MAG: hypothetical protein QOE64_2831 [Frankiales bacterium]|jgi:hypothetical protein|nr:hypothetical protein [Frankiales bacterium]